LLKILTGEFILKRRANGGEVILLRSLWIASFAYIAAIVAKEVITPGHLWTFSWFQARLAISETITWWGAIFAGVYVALYARFASQWAYLAGLYNQINEAKLQAESLFDKGEKTINIWWSGFIEDAEELHLATKPMFAGVIKVLLEREGVRRAYIEGVAGGEDRLKCLDCKIQRAWKRAAARY
jgi:hypothetical protein